MAFGSLLIDCRARLVVRFPSCPDPVAWCRTVCRYVEANPLRAGLVERAELWPFSSLGYHPDGPPPIRLAAWPVDRPGRWVESVNRRMPDAALAAVRESVNRGRPFGEENWTTRVAKRLGLESTMRRVGRPRLAKNEK